MAFTSFSADIVFICVLTSFLQTAITHLFAMLEKTRLGGEHPDYHTLWAALSQVLHGFILNACWIESGHTSLDDFSKTNPSPQEILELAHKVMANHTIPQPCFNPTNTNVPLKDLNMVANPLVDSQIECESDGEEIPEDKELPPASDLTDVVYDNTILLTCDLLYVSELMDAMAMGDFGRVEDILPTLACMFRGVGSNNYSTEILHLLFNFKEVWTPEFG